MRYSWEKLFHHICYHVLGRSIFQYNLTLFHLILKLWESFIALLVLSLLYRSAKLPLYVYILLPHSTYISPAFPRSSVRGEEIKTYSPSETSDTYLISDDEEPTQYIVMYCVDSAHVLLTAFQFRECSRVLICFYFHSVPQPRYSHGPKGSFSLGDQSADALLFQVLW